ncbi:MAG: PocR ligand-binding domain-containing protein [Methanosarcinales archaeon]|nr:PocR ligand-binding domain-containing protein [Methanosarcinales archaeon]
MNNSSLHDLIDLDELQAIQDKFARAVGLSFVIFSPEGEPLKHINFDMIRKNHWNNKGE